MPNLSNPSNTFRAALYPYNRRYCSISASVCSMTPLQLQFTCCFVSSFWGKCPFYKPSLVWHFAQSKFKWVKFFLRKVNSWAVSWCSFPLCILLLGGCCSPTSAVISSSSIRMYCCLSSSEDNHPEWCMYWTHSKICLWTSQYLRWVYAIKLIMIGELPKWKHIIALLIFSLGKQR